MITLPGYCITEQIYAGIRTLAYRGIRKSDRQPVVVKILRNEYPSFNELAQFKNEYAIGKNLDHPGAIETYSLEPYQNRYALVMEDFGGISLKEWMGRQQETKQSRQEQITNFFNITLQIAATLEALHRCKTIHKDIQPANILIEPTTQIVKLIDFSIASILPKEQPVLVNPNVIEGTLAYLSPEQTGRMNRGIDYRTDFYSLGVTCYELLSGQLPFCSTEPMELVHCHIAKQPPALGNGENIPPVLSDIVMKLMAKNAEDRYQSAFGLKRDLERCFEEWQATGRIERFQLGSQDISDRFTIPEKLYGREKEVSKLLAAFDRVAGRGENQEEDTPNRRSAEDFQDRGEIERPQDLKIENAQFSLFNAQSADLKIQPRSVLHLGQRDAETPSRRSIQSKAIGTARTCVEEMGCARNLQQVDRATDRWKRQLLPPHPPKSNPSVRYEASERADAANRLNFAAICPPSATSPSPHLNIELMLVAGFSGIGKTAAIEEVRKPIARQKGYFIKGKFDQLGRNIPFSAFVQAFRDLIEQLLGESSDRLERWKNQLLKALGQDAQAIIEVIPELERIIGPQPPVAELSPAAAQNRFKLLFEKFIGTFAKAEHPLAIFLDDLQWSDTASLKLIQLLMGETDGQHLLLIGAYRDNEVSAAHPLMLTLDEICRTRANVNWITLAPLDLASLNQLVADTLSCSLERAAPLTDLVLHKTKGNPFFVRQFLKSLHDEGLISFDYDRGGWQCDIAKVRALAITDDVVEFMALQLQKLPPETQNALKLGACLGNRFELSDLARVREQSLMQAAAHLEAGVREGLIVPSSDCYTFFHVLPSEAIDSTPAPQSLSYQFLHDRVQQAAYFLIPNDQKAATHLKIGQLLWRDTPESERDEKIFAIVNPLNLGRELIRDRTEREQLARLNAIAGRKAKNATAYSAATDYFKIGRELLDADGWQQQYDLAFALHKEAAEAAYSSGDFDDMERLSQIALQQAKKLSDTVQIYDIKIQAYAAQKRLLDAVKTGLTALDLLGFPLPEQPTESEIALELEAVSANLAGRAIEALVELPPMQDSTARAAMKILSRITPAIYMAAPQLYPLVVGKQVNLSLEYGNTPTSAYAYSSYGLSLCGARRAGNTGSIADIEMGYRFGKLALNLLEQYSLKEFKARTLLVVNVYILPWKEALRTTLPSLRAAYSEALDAGNTETAGYCAVSYCYHSYYAGKALEELDRDMTLLCEALEHLHLETALSHIAPYRQAVVNLIGDREKPWELSGPICDEAEFLPTLLQENDLTGIFYFYLNQLILGYLFGEFDRALECALRAEKYAAGAASSMSFPVFLFYQALVRLARSRQNGDSTAELLAGIAATQEQMRDWMQHAPANFAHKFYLIEAERYRLEGEKLQAMELYDRAIAAAKQHEYPQEEAIANELAAQFYLDWGRAQFAQPYLLEAYYSYARWGAKAKADDLERRYSELLASAIGDRSAANGFAADSLSASLSIHNTIQTVTSARISQVLDLAAITKVYQTLSSEIQLDRLLSTLMRVVLENAGAERGALILPEGGLWVVTAIASADGTETALQSIPLETARELPVSLVHYVQRTLKTLVIDDAATETAWACDPYIIEQQSKSLLCAPLLDRGKLLGLLYLENHLTAGAFTSDRVEVLNLLCAQAAISLENARLYQNLQHSLDELQAAQLQLVQSEKMSALGNLVAGVAHEINNPLGFIEGNLHLALDYVRDLFGLLGLYQEHYPQPIAEVAEEIDAIELDYLQEDFPKLLSSMQEGADRIHNISKSLRVFSRADSDRPVSFDLHEGIDSTLLILKHRLKANDRRGAIEVVKDYGDLPALEVFPGQLNQVFMNIIANAIDALEEALSNEQWADRQATPCITIRTFVLADTNQTCVCIGDNGMGMSSETQQRIFDHLFTTKAVGKGTGLGLSISRQIVEEKHGGRLSCSSQLGQGTEFAIALPLHPACLKPQE